MAKVTPPAVSSVPNGRGEPARISAQLGDLRDHRASHVGAFLSSLPWVPCDFQWGLQRRRSAASSGRIVGRWAGRGHRSPCERRPQEQSGQWANSVISCRNGLPRRCRLCKAPPARTWDRGHWDQPEPRIRAARLGLHFRFTKMQHLNHFQSLPIYHSLSQWHLCWQRAKGRGDTCSREVVLLGVFARRGSRGEAVWHRAMLSTLF